jgi:hypothetical protein
MPHTVDQPAMEQRRSARRRHRQQRLQHHPRQLGIRNALLASQVRVLEAVVGTELLRTGPDERLTLTAYGRRRCQRGAVPAPQARSGR